MVDAADKVDFFISYNKADVKHAEWIAWVLEEARYSTVLQIWDFPPGSNFVLEMDKATKNSRKVIALLSPHYLRSSYTAPEWAAAFVDDPKGDNRKIIPFRVEECKPEGLLKTVVYEDLVGLDEANAKERVLAAIADGRRKPSSAPAYAGGKVDVKFPRTPPIWNVPYTRNPNFVGREETIEKMNGQPYSVLTGLGGAGKTQIAIEYSFRSSADVIWWLRCEDDETLRSDYVELGRELRIITGKAEDAVGEMVQWLNANESWLLVFDSARDFAQLRPYIPARALGAVVVTSQNANWRNLSKPHDIHTLSLDDSVSFLHFRTGLDDPDGAAELSKELDNLPLALENAAGFIESTGYDYTWYLQEYTRVRTRLFSEAPPAPGHEQSIVATCQIAVDEVRQTPGAVDFLNLLSFLAPTSLNETWLFSRTDVLPESLKEAATDGVARARLRTKLRQFSLIRTTGGGIAVHRVIQDIVNDQLTIDERASHRKIVIQSLAAAVGSIEDGVEWQAALPHCLRVLELADAAGDDSPDVGGLHNLVGLYLLSLGEARTAFDHFGRAFEIFKEAFGGLSEAASGAIANQGNAAREAGNLQKAAELLLIAISIDRGLPDSPMKASHLSAYGVTLRHAGKYEEAEIFHDAAIEIAQALEDEASFARDLHNISLVYRAQGRSDLALATIKRASAIEDRIHADVSSFKIRSQSTLGGWYYDIGDLSSSLSAHVDAVERARATGSESARLPLLLNNLAVTQLKMEHFDDAEKSILDALKLDIDMRGSSHPDVGRDLGIYANILCATGRTAEAIDKYTNALEIQKGALGPTHHLVGATLCNMAGALADERRLGEALASIEESISISMKNGKRWNSYAPAVASKASILFQSGKLPEAENALSEAYRASQQAVGDKHPQTKEIETNLRRLKEFRRTQHSRGFRKRKRRG